MKPYELRTLAQLVCQLSTATATLSQDFVPRMTTSEYELPNGSLMTMLERLEDIQDRLSFAVDEVDRLWRLQAARNEAARDETPDLRVVA